MRFIERNFAGFLHMTTYGNSLLIEFDHDVGLNPNCAEREAKLVWFVKVTHVIVRLVHV